MTGAQRGGVHVQAEVLSNKQVGAYRHLTLVAPGVAERCRPGMFLALSVGGDMTSVLGRRSFWVHRAKPTGAYGGTVEVVFETTGEGTRWLAGLGQGRKLALTGPLGRPFAMPREPVTCTLVGHDHGGAALFTLAEQLRTRGCAVHMLLTGRDEPHLFGALEWRRSAKTVLAATADGSVGTRGGVEDVLPDLLTRTDTDVVYACGPHDVLHAVAAIAEQHGAWSQTALEWPVTCGTGLCQGCAVPVVGEDGVTRMVRACADGPVFRGDRVRWDDLGTIPEGAR